MNAPTTARLTMPRGLSPEAQRLWRHGDNTGGITGRRETIGDPPVPGDLWITVCGEDDFGSLDHALVMVTAVDEETREVATVPASTLDDATEHGALLLTGSPLGVPLAIWPGAGSSVGFDVLGRRLGATLDALTLHRVRRYGDLGGTAPLPLVETRHEESA